MKTKPAAPSSTEPWVEASVWQTCPSCHATNKYFLNAAPSTPSLEQSYEQRYREEAAIVDRVWKALGISNYAEANGKAIDELVLELRQPSPEVERLAKAAEALSKKIAAIEASGAYKSVFTLAMIHGAPYAGQNYGEELEALCSALAALQEKMK